MCRSRLIVVAAACASHFVATSAVAQREAPLKASPTDRAAVQACLDLVRKNAEAEAQSKGEDEPATPQGRLQAAAKDAGTDSRSCIGAVSAPCMQKPGGASTAGMIECIGREWAVWDERLNAAYKKALKDAEPKYDKAIRATQRAWLAWREERCKLPGLENEGGSIVGPLWSSCMHETTAGQALWLEER